MKTAFHNLVPNGTRVPVRFDGQVLLLLEGTNLAAALLEVGVSRIRRSPVSGAARGPFCMMGPCQGRYCGLAVTELLAAHHDMPQNEVGAYRIRAPLIPVTLAEIAGLDEEPLVNAPH